MHVYILSMEREDLEFERLLNKKLFLGKQV